MSAQIQPSVAARFSYVESLVDMVITGGSKSLIICGAGGLGKTYTVTDRLKRAGLRSRADVEAAGALNATVRSQYSRTRNFRGGSTYVYEAESSPQGQQTSARSLQTGFDYDYVTVKGYSTAKALYRALYENRTRLVIFDDCDSIWKDRVAVSILKGALDSYSDRWVSWLSELTGANALPRSFLFAGRIIFLSNLPLGALDQAMRSRCQAIDLSMTTVEKLERIAALAPGIRPDVAREVKQDAFNVLVQFAHVAGDLNIRTFLKVLDIRLTDRADWRDLARYVVTAI